MLQACNKAQNVTGSNSCPQAAWDCGDLCSGMCVCTLMRRAHNFGGLREANHPGVCQMDRRFYIVECNLNR